VLHQHREARIKQVARQQDISGRGPEVLNYAVIERRCEDITSPLGITVRTVKFHLSKVTFKLGADSRADLLPALLA